MEQKRPVDIFHEALDYLWNGLGFRYNALKDYAPDNKVVAAHSTFLLGQLFPQYLFSVFKLLDFLLSVLKFDGHFLAGLLSWFRHELSLCSARRHRKGTVDFLGSPLRVIYLVLLCAVR